MNVLIFDTETTGFTQKHLPPHDKSQPDLVQLGAILYDDEKDMVRGEVNLIVTQEPGVVIPKGAADTHGIYDAIAAQYGIPLLVVMSAFNNLAKIADVFVCHNVAYDMVVMKKAYYKIKRDHLFNEKPYVCTMETLRDTIKLPPTQRMLAAGIREYKAPSLMEAYRFVTGGKSFEGAHDAMADVRATLELYKWIKQEKLM